VSAGGQRFNKIGKEQPLQFLCFWFQAGRLKQPARRGCYDPSLPLAFKAAHLFKLRIEDNFDDNGKP